MRHTWLDNLRLIAEYIFYDDAPALIGVSRSALTRYVKGSATPNKAVQKRIAKLAGKMRRRVSQVSRYEHEEATRSARRGIRETLRLLGKPSIKIPDTLLPFLRRFEFGRTGSPVFIYDARDMPPVAMSLSALDAILNEEVYAHDDLMDKIRAHPITQFFRFMKSVLPQGLFFLTYELTTAGIKTDKHGMFFSKNAVESLKKKHNTANPVRAIYAEIGTAGSGAKIAVAPGGFRVEGVRFISTQWKPFCELSGEGTCLMRTDMDLFREWHELNNKTARREVLEIGISYPRPTVFSDEEKEADRLRGADPVTGLQYIWQD